MKRTSPIFSSITAFLFFCALPAAASAEVVTFYDDFERDEIGDAWLSSGGSWSIAVTEEWGHVLRSGASSDHVLLYQGLELDAPWTMEINFHFLGVDTSWGGVTFHAHFDNGVFRNYASRLRTRGAVGAPTDISHQFLEFGNFAIVDWRTPPGDTAPLTIEVPYRMVVSSAEPGSGIIDYAVFDAEENLLFETVLEVPETGDWSDPFTGGWAGLYDIRNLAVYDFRLTVGEPDVGEVSFEAWQAEHFTADQRQDPEIGTEQAAPAGDGISNLLKYALKLSPWESSRHLLPAPAVDEQNLVLSYTRLKGASDIGYLVQVSGELVNWFSGEGYTEEVAVEDQGETETVTVRSLLPADRGFMRLVVEKVE